ncbi:unnamed protein product [Chilo suppressalis]|uniref:Gustatory receptor n=1 Tax=Chilo suppressalis TaxID=168631 RepID=A0ABN8ATG7_CHISP|nr:unnamed protein product [Chilo suppressalis]
MDISDGIFIKQKDFSIILTKKDRMKERINVCSMANSAKPLTYFASFFGLQMIRYCNGSVFKVNLLRKFYCLVVVATIISLAVFVRPFSWRYTKADVPLNMLTKSYSVFHTIEAIHVIFITTFGNSTYYVKLFKILDSTDRHFGLSKKMFKIRIITSILLILLPVIQTSYTFWLSKFNINNIGLHFTFFMIMVQGAIIIFFSINIYLKQMMLNKLLILKTLNTIPSQKRKLFDESLLNIMLKVSTNYNKSV